MIELTADEARTLIVYDPATGVFRWRQQMSRSVRASAIAGGIDPQGYRRIKIRGRSYLASHLAQLLMTGCWPTKTMDHRDCDPSNDRWDNLREASMQQQQWNRRGMKSGQPKGVLYRKRSRRWEAYIRHAEKRLYLGSFMSSAEANVAYAAKAAELRGEFGRGA